MSVSRCQRCQEEITVPAGLAPASEVQCPLCQDVFELAEVLAATPPALIVVNAVPSTQPALQPALQAAGSFGSFGSFDPDADVAAPSFSLDSPPEGEGDFGELRLADAPSTPSFAATGTAEASAPSPAQRSQPRKRKGKNPMVEILKVLVGGVVGLGGGYFILLWLFGVNAVPDLTNTISRYAAFAVPTRFHDPSLGTNGSSEVEGGDNTNTKGGTLPPLADATGQPGDDTQQPAEVQPAIFGGNNPTNDGSETVGSETVGSETVGSETVGSETVGSETVGSDTPGIHVDDPTRVLDDNSTDSGNVETTDHPTAIDVALADHFVVKPPKFSLDELTSAIARAEQGFRTWNDTDSGGDPKVQAVKAMVILGELLPYADQDNDAVKPIIPQVVALMKRITDKDKQKYLIDTTDRWVRLPRADRAGMSGFLAIGKVGITKPVGDYFATPIQLAGESRTPLTVLSKAPSSTLSNGKVVSVLGTIVDDPVANIKGYVGTDERVVILAAAVDLTK